MDIMARMRTYPQENLDFIDVKAPLIPIEMWKDFSDPAKVRVEKQRRQIVEDGKTTILLVKADGETLAAKFEGFGGRLL